MKRETRTVGIIVMIMVLWTMQIRSQGMPVYDNTNFITLGKQIIESAKQTAELLKTVEFLREQKERIEKVNDVIKQLKAVREIARNNERLFNVVRDDLRGILSSPHIRPVEVERVSDSFNSIIENALDDFDFISEILSSDHLKMTDGERAKVLKEREQKSKEMVSEIERRTERYKEIIAFREMQERINNRDTNF